MFTITCPHCDGSGISARTGERCGVCFRGEKKLYRCPTSHIDSGISIAIRHFPHAEEGRFPAAGGVLDQAPSFLHFHSVLSGEMNKIRRDEMEAERTKNKAKAASANVRKRR
jgi:hypothetical protein